MNHCLPSCRSPLLPSFSAAVQDFPPAVPAVRTRVGCNDGYIGGHSNDTLTWGLDFAAFEQPELFVEDVRAFFASVR